MSNVTSPIMLDATGQDIASKINTLNGKLDAIKEAIQPDTLPVSKGGTGQTTIADVQSAFGIGDPSQLETVDKSNLVSAVNENNEAIATLNDKITTVKTTYISGTTSANGNLEGVNFGSKKVKVLSAWSNLSDTIVLQFPVRDATASGQSIWWFHCMGVTSAHTVVANTAVTIYFTYIEE